ncbi:thiol reductant ABC exporter subunit CydC [Planococcus sp. ISL-109]|uniref:thiol reductant ABC exporter subunit CydC n=1 Tax=Planococcus sp. ISL-109 TaxID=2819166 RepID=UPI001BE82539|nr:thiol reductant ABC exporter subunit CydC [Planococcus sp. ISL-109]MBT2581317.1 thiol reductant ABC exporter subunit CydC [Planococcus sp. ISL-109]
MSDLKAVFWLTLKEKRDVALAVLFGFLAGLAGVALLGASGYLISKAALTAQMTTLVVMAASLKLFGFAAAITRYGERLFSHRATFTMLGHLRGNLFERLSPLAPGIFQRYKSGDLLSRIVGDVESLQNFLLRVLYPPIVVGMVLLATVFFTSFYSLPVAIVILGGAVFSVVILPMFFAYRRRNKSHTTRASRGEFAAASAEFLYGFRDLKIHLALDRKSEDLQEQAHRYEQAQQKEGLEENRVQSINALFAFLTSFFVLAIGAYFVSTGELSGLYLAMLVMVSLGAFENTGPLAALPAYFEESRIAARRLEEVVDQSPDNSTGLMKQGLPDITVDDVSYHYPSDGRLALENISFHLPAGSKTAIVGPSGSGKSTLLLLLLKVIEPDGGSVQIGGSMLATTQPESLWQRMNVVLQDNHFFAGTIESNLRIASSEARPEQLQEALELVRLAHLELSAPVLEKGRNLSGGEKQRLAMARAFLKRERLWLLDEPFSSVDGLTAQSIYKELFTRHADDSFVVISHDLAGLEAMDQILVLENGRLIESGTYAELMGRRSYFYGLKKIEEEIFV